MKYVNGKWVADDGTTMKYVNKRLPTEIPAGQYLVHSRVVPSTQLGRNGFRAWLQDNNKNIEPCSCNFGGVVNASLHAKHYRAP